uniref:Uncharacterized protein n=1 Tax=Parascaris univalens TaxID=6257 RepID=A0A915CJE8_PARUN
MRKPMVLLKMSILLHSPIDYKRRIGIDRMNVSASGTAVGANSSSLDGKHLVRWEIPVERNNQANAGASGSLSVASSGPLHIKTLTWQSILSQLLARLFPASRKCTIQCDSLTAGKARECNCELVTSNAEINQYDWLQVGKITVNGAAFEQVTKYEYHNGLESLTRMDKCKVREANFRTHRCSRIVDPTETGNIQWR